MKRFASLAEDKAERVEKIMNENNGDLSDSQKVQLGKLLVEEDEGVKKAISVLEKFLESEVKEIEHEIRSIEGLNPQ